MAVAIRITEPYRFRHRLSDKVKWLMDRVPTKEFRVEFEHEEEDDTIINVGAIVTIWSEDAEKIAVDYWWFVG